MRKLLPPVPTPKLAEWSASARQNWADRAERATALTRNPGSGRNFEALMMQAKALLSTGDEMELSERLADRRFIRALVTVWTEDTGLAQRTMTPQMLDLVSRHSPSRLTILTLMRLFLSSFDTLDVWHQGLFETLGSVLRSAVAAYPPRDVLDGLDPIRRHDNFLLSVEGPQHLAGMLVREGGDLTEWMRQQGLSGYQDTRFGQLAREEHYLAQIAAADAEQEGHDFLTRVTDEVLARLRTETTDVDGRYFGHRVLEGLTAKITRWPSGQWLNAMLDIGGDPRMAQTEEWRMWWSKLPTENETRDC